MQSATAGWKGFAALSVAVLGAYLALPAGPARLAVYHLGLLLAAGAVGAGFRLRGPARPSAWWALLGAMLTLGAHSVLAAYAPPRWGYATSAAGQALMSVLFVGAALQAVLFAALLVRGPGRRRDLEGIADSTVVGAAVAVVLWEALTGASFGTEVGQMPPGLMATLVVLVAAMAAMVVRLLFAVSGSLAAAWLLVGAAAGVTASCVAMALLFPQGYPLSARQWVEAPYLAGVLCAGAAAFHPSMSALAHRAPRAGAAAGLPVGRLTVLAAALLTPSAVGLWRALSSSAVLPSAAGALITLVVCWRLWRLVTERERARDELSRRADQQAAVARLGQAALEGIALNDLLDAAVEAADWLLDLREGCAVYQPADRELGGVPAAVEQALGSGELVRTDDVTAVPVSSPAHTLAVLAVRPGAGGLDGEDLHFLQAVAAVLAGAMEHRRAEQSAQHSALHDPLTGLPNRVLLMERLAQQTASGHGGAVLFVDLDRFKEVNDTFGHGVGDQLLVEVAHRMTTLLRPEDTLARLAGDEFVVLCDGVVSEKVAVALGGRIRDALSQPFPLPAGVAQVSGSVGVVLVSAEADAERLLRDADMAMYQAKRAGRDQVAALIPPA